MGHQCCVSPTQLFIIIPAMAFFIYCNYDCITLIDRPGKTEWRFWAELSAHISCICAEFGWKLGTPSSIVQAHSAVYSNTCLRIPQIFRSFSAYFPLIFRIFSVYFPPIFCSFCICHFCSFSLHFHASTVKVSDIILMSATLLYNLLPKHNRANSYRLANLGNYVTYNVVSDARQNKFIGRLTRVSDRGFLTPSPSLVKRCAGEIQFLS